jgi:hypothetical protein
MDQRPGSYCMRPAPLSTGSECGNSRSCIAHASSCPLISQLALRRRWKRFTFSVPASPAHLPTDKYHIFPSCKRYCLHQSAPICFQKLSWRSATTNNLALLSKPNLFEIVIPTLPNEYATRSNNRSSSGTTGKLYSSLRLLLSVRLPPAMRRASPRRGSV